MGNDTPISALSSKAKLLHTYFKQNFAQVTNPPIDSIREELVMSLVSFIGPRPNILDIEGTSKVKRLEVIQPILTNEDLERIRQIGEVKDNHFSSITLDITFAVENGPGGMAQAVDVVCAEAEEAVRSGDYNIIILSDRATGPDRIPIPSLLATSAVHHHLIRQGLRTLGGSRGRDGRSARDPPVLHACRLRRGSDQPLSRVRYARAHDARARRGPHARRRQEEVHQGHRQGADEGHGQDGHLDLPVLLRRADLRRRGPAHVVRTQVFHRHAYARRGRRHARDRTRDLRPSCGRVRQRAGARQRARCRRRLCLSRTRRSARVAAERRRRPAARRARDRERSRNERQDPAEVS